MLFRKVLISRKKNLTLFGPSTCSFAIVRQRSVTSIITSKNSSLLLIVWKNLKTVGLILLADFLLIQTLKNVSGSPFKKCIKETHTAKRVSQGNGWARSPGTNPTLLKSPAVTISLFFFKEKRLSFSPCPLWNGIAQPRWMPRWELGVLKWWHKAAGYQAGFSFGAWPGWQGMSCTTALHSNEAREEG